MMRPTPFDGDGRGQPPTMVSDLNLWPTIVAYLEARGITTIDELASKTRTELESHGFGISRFREIEEALAAVGRSLTIPEGSGRGQEMDAIYRKKLERRPSLAHRFRDGWKPAIRSRDQDGGSSRPDGTHVEHQDDADPLKPRG